MLREFRFLLSNNQTWWEEHLFIFAPVGHMRYGISYDRYEGAKRKILRYQGMWRKKRVELSFGASSVITNVYIDLFTIGLC